MSKSDRPVAFSSDALEESGPEGGGLADPSAPEGHALSEKERAELATSLKRLERFARDARSEATRRAYASDLEDFRHWCSEYGREWLPATPETVGLYIGARARELKLSTLERRLAAIATLHQDEGYESPASVSEAPLRRIWRGLVREKTRRQDSPEPLLVEDLRQMVTTLPRYEEAFERGAFRADAGDLTLTTLRDRAVLLVGWAGALRRSELVALRAEDVKLRRGKGYTLRIGRSKTDQEAEGQHKAIPYGAHAESCPVLALRTWMQSAARALGSPTGELGGPIFRRFYRGESIGDSAMSGKYVSRIVKDGARRLEMDPADYSAHSLRSGFITQAVWAGKRERRVKEHSGHASWDVFSSYAKAARGFQENPAEDIGL